MEKPNPGTYRGLPEVQLQSEELFFYSLMDCLLTPARKVYPARDLFRRVFDDNAYTPSSCWAAEVVL